MIAPNNSFNPNPLRSTNNMAGRACHVVGSTTQVGLTQALGGMDGMFVVTVEASPLPGSDKFLEFGGAHINVYTTASETEAEAIAIATAEVRDAGWQPDAVNEINWVTRDDLTEPESGLEYFEQALIDGIVVVVHTFPPSTGDQVIAH